MNKRLPVRFTSFLLGMCLLLLTSCTFESGQNGGWFRAEREKPVVLRTETPGRMNEFELVQSIVLAVNEDVTASAVFENIPARQRNDVTLSAFTRYVTLIRRVVQSDVHGITLASDEAHAQYLAQTSAQSDEMAALAAQSVFYDLNYQDESSRNSVFAMAIQLGEERVPYLSSEWIDAMLRIYDFVELYFAAVDSDDAPALKALLKQGETAALSETMDAALLQKAQDTIAFYNRRVITSPLDYNLIALLPGFASVEHYATVSLGSARRENRTVLFADANGLIAVSDKVPSELDPQDIDVYYQDIKLFTLGSDDDRLLSSEIEPLAGLALTHTSQNCRIVNSAATFQFQYKGLTVSGHGSCDRHVDWEGTIDSASLTYSAYRLGSGLTVGMPVSELYLRYPFARESSYVIEGAIDDKAVSLAVQVEQGYITKLTLTESP